MNKYVFFILLFPYIHTWEIEFEHSNYTIFMDQQFSIPFNLTSEKKFTVNITLEILPDTSDVISLDTNYNIHVENGFATTVVYVTGVFLGKSRLIFILTEQTGSSQELDTLEIIVIREKSIIDSIFIGSVATLVSLIYVNFGCALNLDSLKSILKRPIGPLIGFFGQFGVMPVLSYLIGMLVFSDMPEMALGLFFTGVSPAGGASNIWTVLLDGNIDLSITMTTLSTLCAFLMMPLWLFTLGKYIFQDAKIGVPYSHIASLAFALIIPLFLGILIRKFFPKISTIFVRVLKGFSALLILFIIIFAIVTNLYLFKLATWKIAVAGLLLPWLGYLLGACLALLLKQPPRDVTAIAIETGVQNTGIAIFLLRFSLPQPQADLTTIIPVAIACMTPIPLSLLLIYKKCFRNRKNSADFLENSELN